MGEAQTERDIVANGITLHVTEQGTGPLVMSAMVGRSSPIPGATRSRT